MYNFVRNCPPKSMIFIFPSRTACKNALQKHLFCPAVNNNQAIQFYQRPIGFWCFQYFESRMAFTGPALLVLVTATRGHFIIIFPSLSHGEQPQGVFFMGRGPGGMGWPLEGEIYTGTTGHRCKISSKEYLTNPHTHSRHACSHWPIMPSGKCSYIQLIISQRGVINVICI